MYIKQTNANSSYESYDFYVKDEVEGCQLYNKIGERSFGIDKARGFITTGYMKSEVNDRLAGVGIRGHQLAIERMLQLGLDNVEIISVADAFPFHYKCGFAPVENTDLEPSKFEDSSIDEIVSWYSQNWKVPESVVKSCIAYNTYGDKTLVNEGLMSARIALNRYLNNEQIPEQAACKMILPPNQLNEWKCRAKMQPILLEVK